LIADSSIRHFNFNTTKNQGAVSLTWQSASQVEAVAENYLEAAITSHYPLSLSVLSSIIRVSPL
jgi:hypothetical protein